MYSVEVYTTITREDRITRWLVFETYSSAANCIFCLTGREPGLYSPQDYFETAKIFTYKKGEQLNREPIETDWVLTYLFSE